MKRHETILSDYSSEKLPEEILQYILSFIPWQDVNTLCSVILICKKGFDFIIPQCKALIMAYDGLDFQSVQSDDPQDLCSIFLTIKSGEIYFNKENLYLLYRLTYDIACYDENPPFSEVDEYVFSEIYVIDRINYSLIPLKQSTYLKFEEFKLPDLISSHRVLNEVESFALSLCREETYTKVLQFYIYQKETKTFPPNDNTIISNLLIDGIPFYSKKYIEKRKSFVYKGKYDSTRTYFRNSNLKYAAVCCRLLDIVYQCVCDYHDIYSCTYYEYG